jgi:hypothetical protein
MPARIWLSRLDRLDKPIVPSQQRTYCRYGVGVNQEAENGINLLTFQEPKQFEDHTCIKSAASFQGGDRNAFFTQLIRHRAPTVETRDMNGA